MNTVQFYCNIVDLFRMCRLDRVFSGGDAGCKTLFSDLVEPLVDGLLAGSSASVIAYGQSGSGKSRVMGFADTAGDTGGSGNGGGIGGSAADLAGVEAKHAAGAAAGPLACRQDGDAAAVARNGWAGAVLLRAAVHLFEQIDELQQRDSDVQVGTTGTRRAARIARQYCCFWAGHSMECSNCATDVGASAARASLLGWQPSLLGGHDSPHEPSGRPTLDCVHIHVEHCLPFATQQVSVACAVCEVSGAKVLDLKHPSDLPPRVPERALSEEGAGLTHEAVSSAAKLQVCLGELMYSDRHKHLACRSALCRRRAPA